MALAAHRAGDVSQFLHPGTLGRFRRLAHLRAGRSMKALSSRDNPRVRRWQALVRDARLRREQGRALIEGAHLVAACLDAGGKPVSLIVSDAAAHRPEVASLIERSALPALLVSDSLFRSISDTETPTGIAAEIALPEATPIRAGESTILLDAVQDAGNVGTILRSAAAFGIRRAILGPGCADPWSPKVLRAAMGAHFSLAIAQSRDLAAGLRHFAGRLVCATPRDGTPLWQAEFPECPAWLFGAEGRGVSKALAARAALRVSVPMPGGSESLNVAAAVAICLYEWTRRFSTGAAGSAARA
jgi:TrmH family RNA methyltransferase